MKILSCQLALLFTLFLSSQVFADTMPAQKANDRGTILGGVDHSMPDWFKNSFLEIEEDVAEAASADKHVMLFFHLDNCPYCDRMIQESLDASPTKEFVQKNFDVIAINTKGGREIALDANTSLTEKELSLRLKVKYTPNLFFLNNKNKMVLRLTGYRAPERLQKTLEYVKDKTYQTTSLSSYLENNLTKPVYSLRDNSMFSDVSDLSTIKGPIAVIFEDSRCADCDYLHDRLLTHPEILPVLERFTIVRLDADSKQTIVDVSGKNTSPNGLAKDLKISYRPGIVLFDLGTEITRISGLVYPYHFRETLRFAGNGFYQQQTYREYMTQRKEELLASGIDIDYAE